MARSFLNGHTVQRLSLFSNDRLFLNEHTVQRLSLSSNGQIFLNGSLNGQLIYQLLSYSNGYSILLQRLSYIFFLSFFSPTETR